MHVCNSSQIIILNQQGHVPQEYWPWPWDINSEFWQEDMLNRKLGQQTAVWCKYRPTCGRKAKPVAEKPKEVCQHTFDDDKIIRWENRAHKLGH